MHIGISTMIYETEKKLDELQEFSFINELGMKYIELSDAFDFQQNVLDALFKQNLNVFSVHAEYMDADISSPDERMRTNGINDALNRIKYLERLNGRILIMHPGGWYQDRKEKDVRIKNCIKSLVSVLNRKSSKNIKIAIENLPPEFFGDEIEVMKFMLGKVRKITGAEKDTGICLDTGHALLTDSIFDYLDILYEDILSIHLHDNAGDNNGDRSQAADDLHAVPGKGIIDWSRIFNILAGRHYSGGLIFEIRKGKENIGQTVSEIKHFIDSNLFLKKNI